MWALSWNELSPYLAIFLADFAQYMQNGNLPDFTLLTICCDHTSGISTGFPAP
jgi:hypothetical protein